ncbi:hypothetical protein EDC04DRAFT_2604835 [Pisolithus marmoratus]|nr:hypothetical protein EDC04DRAFT_2604835 [Pisolithus marmoratus]
MSLPVSIHFKFESKLSTVGPNSNTASPPQPVPMSPLVLKHPQWDVTPVLFAIMNIKGNFTYPEVGRCDTLIRFLSLLDVDTAWYVPNPSLGIFCMMKSNHNILQGIAIPDLHLTQEAKD